jgi:hypothetical protein
MLKREPSARHADVPLLRRRDPAQGPTESQVHAIFESDGWTEGRNAFAEKRPPVYQER